MAETVFQNMVDDAGLSAQIMVDSAGTSSYHVGERAASGTGRVLANTWIDRIMAGLAKLMRADMADEKSYIIAMDSANMRDLRSSFWGPSPPGTALVIMLNKAR